MRWVSLACVSVLPCLGACGAAEETPRPNVILISLDTLRADHLGLYGYERDTTPYLDGFAAECIVFDNAYATAAWTLVSHMSMLTGLYPRQHGVHHGDQALNPATPLLAERLRGVGYQTIGLYFQSWVHPCHGFDRGFDVFRRHANAEEAGEHLAEELATLDPDRPYFLFVHLFDIHGGVLTDEPGSIYEPPRPFDEQFMTAPASHLAHRTEKEIWDSRSLPAEELEALTALYDGGIRYVDSKLERWVEDWRAEGRLADTLVLITADHGESLGQRGSVKGHGMVYQEGLRVPLLLRLPGAHVPGKRSPEVVSLVDIVPTVLEILGLSHDDVPGHSLLEPLDDRIVLAYQELGAARETGIRWPWKIAHSEKGSTLGVNLEADPMELHPHRAEPEQLADWRRAVLGGPETLARWPAALSIRKDPEDLDELRALGYSGDDE